MKNQKKIFFEVFIISLSILFSSFVWRYISIPYTSTDIIGNYSNNNYNQNNDLLRYLFFISFPLTIFIIARFYQNKNSIRIFLYNLKNISTPNNKDNFLNLLFITFIFFIFFEFLSIEFISTSLDFYHDGQRMSSAFKSYFDNSLWSGSYITVGIFYETIATKFSWNFFDIISVGAARFVEIFLVLINKILLTIFAFQISKNSELKIILKCLFFLCNFIIFQNLINYNLGEVDLLTFRELPILLLLVVFPYIIKKNQSSHIFIIFIGILSLPTLFWGLDRGIVFNILILLIVFYLIIVNRYLRAFLLLLSILFSWLVFSYFLGNEFDYFLSNSFLILQEINNIHGIIHPIPFSDEPNSARATKGLLFIVISIILSLSLFFSTKHKYCYYLKSILLLISICCFLSYLNAIGRSDGPHIRSAFGYPVIFFSTFILINFFQFFENKRNLFSLNNYKTKVIIFLSIVIIIFLNFDIKIKNISSFLNRLQLYVNLKDSEFISEEYSMFISDVEMTLKNQECVQLFTNNAALLYLLRKKSCTKYYFVWSVGSIDLQKRFIAELEDTIFIIDDDPQQLNSYSPYYKLPTVSKFIKSNYELFYAANKLRILKLK